ncbi:MAG TPA: ATP-dependent zinc metalloprotease FtsH [Acidimicrobiales bacterium]|nr:ATP-dependent zinc metalloprotease FtsH [Acidimicrobiales bacterium]
MPLFNRRGGQDDNGSPPASGAERGRKAIPYVAAFLLVQILVYAVVLATVRPDERGRQMSIDRFNRLVQEGEITEVTILDYDSRITGRYAGSSFTVALPRGELAVNNAVTGLVDAKVKVVVDQQVAKGILNFLAQFLLPVLLFFTLFGLLFLLFLRSSALGGLSRFGRTGARRYQDGDDRVTFADVAGMDETVKELEEVKDFLQRPERFLAVGARVPRGVLLMGPPGCGKTLLARAVAGEAGVPFYSVAASEFDEMLVGVGASRVRDLFRTARENAPSIVFIDELDAVGRSRNAISIGSNESDRTLNELLVQMDGFAADSRVVVITATNRFDVLDDALTRPGRFDRHVTVDLPDIAGREAILQVHLRGKPVAPDVDVHQLARRTPGFSGADLANVVNEAAIHAGRRGSQQISRQDFEDGIDRVTTGPERRTRILSPIEKRTVAYHEAGHALVAWALPGADPIHKVSVVSRGRSLGHTRQLPEQDRYLHTRTHLENRMAILLAGRLAEVLVTGEPSTTAADDLRNATELARRMVMDLGMSEQVAPLAYRREPGFEPMPGQHSEEVARKLDAAVAEVVRAAEERATALLTTQRRWLDQLAAALEERETLDGDEIDFVLDGMERPLDPEPLPAATTGLGGR